MANSTDNDNILFNIQQMLHDDDGSEQISLLSPEEENEMDNEEFPSEIPILPLRNTVLFPGVVIPITISRDKSIKLINDAYRKDKIVGVVAQKKESVEDPSITDLYEMGTFAKILKIFRLPDGNTTVIIQGKKRLKIEEIVVEDPYLKARVSTQQEMQIEADEQVSATVQAIKDLAIQIVDLSPNLPSDANIAIRNIDSPRFLLNFISGNLNVSVAEKQSILEEQNYQRRAEMVMLFLSKEHQLLELKNKISSKVRFDIDKEQREYFLHQQLKAIQEELGHEGPEQDIQEMLNRAAELNLPVEVRKTFDKEISKLQRTNPATSEYGVTYNYLELILDLPWSVQTQDKLDIPEALKILDEDHFGLEKVKERILEYLAVLKLKGNMKSPILCLYGPPGVGKTSLGKSIAKAMGRNYTRMSFGGLHDEAEIRGHRKTYIGAMPGRIIQNLKKAKSNNPVFVLDEIDKIGTDFRGDASSALLEVLDPEQNNSFYDNYLELEFDLSNVMFIATANNLDSIQPALRDRLEVIDISGYIIEEKVQIAKNYLVPKQIEMHGLKKNQLKVPDDVIEHLIEQYTREAGVRGLEKLIASLARSRAKDIVAGEKGTKATIKIKDAHRILGPARYEKELNDTKNIAGVATGLAWTPFGGDVLFIETLLTPGTGKILLTGKLGDVMKESAYTAYSYLKSQFMHFNIDPKVFDKWDVHIHVPEGAVPKDGPSAGVTMFTSLASAFTQRKIRGKMAMTGEITLRGQVLPVGGIKEKILAAKRLGIKDIVMCKQNEKDVKDISERYVEGLTFHYVSNMIEVVNYALLSEQIPAAMPINLPDKHLGSFEILHAKA